MTLELWLLYLGAVILLSLTPGPNGLLAVSHGARYGLGPTLYTITGGVVGFLLLMILSMIGLGGIMLASVWAFTLLKLAGAAYLIYLGIRQWRATVVEQAQVSGDKPIVGGRQLFREGMLVALSNPKVILFFLAFLPQFIVTEQPLMGQLLILAATFCVVEFMIEVLLAATARKAMGWIGSPSGAGLFNRITGGLFVGAGCMLALSQR